MATQSTSATMEKTAEIKGKSIDKKRKQPREAQVLTSAAAAILKTNYGKRVATFEWNKMNEILNDILLEELCALRQPPPVAELKAIGAFLAEKVGRVEIAKVLRVGVRLAVDTASKVFEAWQPSMKRVI